MPTCTFTKTYGLAKSIVEKLYELVPNWHNYLGLEVKLIKESAASYSVPLATEVLFPCVMDWTALGKGYFAPLKLETNKLARRLGHVVTRSLYFIFPPREKGKIHETSCVIYLLKNFPLPFPLYALCFPSELLLSQYQSAFVERQ